MKKNLALFLILSFSFSSTCLGASGSELSRVAERAKSALIGVPVTDVISCAGVPTENATIGGVDYMTYRLRGCVATLTVQNSIISKVGYSGHKGAIFQPWQREIMHQI